LTVVDEELRRIKTKILNHDLPVWEDYSLLQEPPLEERLDNHYYSVAYEKALLELKKLDSADYEPKCLEVMVAAYFTGLEPKEEGDIPLIEKANVMPNVVLPSFEKFGTIEDDNPRMQQRNMKRVVQADDLLLSKDGSPGVVSAVTEGLIEELRDKLDYEQAAVATHVYRIVLNEEHRKYAPFIGAFMNSKLGQALVRRYVSGSVSPTIRRNDVGRILVVVPKDDTLADEMREKLAELQRQAVAYSMNVGLSNDLVSQMFGFMPDIPRLPINWMPGAKRDPHGYDKE